MIPAHRTASGGRTSPGLRALVGAAAFVVLVAGLRAARPILVPVLVSVFVAVACAPLVFGLRRRGVPTVPAVLVVVLGLIAAVGALGALVGTSLTGFVLALPTYQAGLREETGALIAWVNRNPFGLTVSAEQVLAELDPGRLLAWGTALVSGVGAALTRGLLVTLTVVFILLEAAGFGAKLRRALAHPEAVLPQFDAFAAGVKQYLVIKTAVSLVTGTLVAVLTAALGVDFPLLWGLIAFLFNYVPNIGSIVAAIPAVLLALVQGGGGLAALVALGYLAINLTMGNFLEPRWMGREAGLSPLVVFVALLFWAFVLGPMGLLLSVPLTMMLKIGLESHEDTRWLAILMGPDDTPPIPAAPELEAAGVDVDALDAAVDRAEAHAETRAEPAA